MKLKTKFTVIIASIFALSGCLTNGDLLRPAFFTATYDKGDALLAANGQPIKVNVLLGNNRNALAERVSLGLNQHGPKWLNARYAPAESVDADTPYQMKWVFDSDEGGHAPGLCRKNSNDLESSDPASGVVLAAFCRGEKTLSSIRGRISSKPESDKFLKTIGTIGRELLVIRNPVRNDDCFIIDDC